MANKYIDTTFVDKAIKFAVDAHSNTERRGKGFPYVIHVLEAMEIVATLTNDPNLLAAACLHDTVEDTNVTLDQIRKEFGDTVAQLVELESDKNCDSSTENATWTSRKQKAMERLEKAPREAKIVAMGDKLSNMRAIARDYRKKGDELWGIFHAPNGKSDHEWHYRGLAIALSDLAGTEAYSEFTKHIEDVFGAPKPEKIDLNDYVESGAGFTAKSYNHKNGEKMMKLYEAYVSYPNIERELTTSWAIRNLGLKIPRAYRLITDGTRVGVEFERISPKRSFARAISEEPEKIKEYATLFAQQCKLLHATPCDTTKFESAAEFYRNVVKETKKYSDAEKQKMLAFIDSLPKETTCLHGDLHIGNIITNGTDIYWIDLADFRYGNPLLDMGMVYLTCKCNSEELTQELYHISNAQMAEVWNAFVVEYFGKDADIEAVTKTCASVAALYKIAFDNRGIKQKDFSEFVQKTILQ